MTNQGIKTTAVPGPPTTATVDNPMCTCCTPQQPLEPLEEKNKYRCPVTGKEYTFDPAEGVVRPAAAATQRQNVETTRREEGFFPQAPTAEAVRQVDPSDGFA